MLHKAKFVGHVGHFSLSPNTHACFEQKKNTDIEMIVLIHTIWHVIAELSLPSWQRDARDITYQVIKAISEAKKDETAV